MTSYIVPATHQGQLTVAKYKLDGTMPKRLNLNFREAADSANNGQ